MYRHHKSSYKSSSPLSYCPVLWNRVTFAANIDCIVLPQRKADVFWKTALLHPDRQNNWANISSMCSTWLWSPMLLNGNSTVFHLWKRTTSHCIVTSDKDSGLNWGWNWLSNFFIINISFVCFVVHTGSDFEESSRSSGSTLWNAS